MIPRIICHIMSSVDGRLLPSRWTPPFDNVDASLIFQQYVSLAGQLNTDAWMFGKATTKEFFPEGFMPKTDRKAKIGKVFRPNLLSRRLFITIDPDGDILYTSNTLRGDNIVVILGRSATAEYLDFLKDKGIGFIVMDDAKELRKGMEILAEKFEVKSISLQGGGIIDGAMLAAGLLHELSLVVYPGIDGNTTSPSIFEYLGHSGERPAANQSLQLISAETLEHGVVSLRYKFHHRTPE